MELERWAAFQRYKGIPCEQDYVYKQRDRKIEAVGYLADNHIIMKESSESTYIYDQKSIGISVELD